MAFNQADFNRLYQGLIQVHYRIKYYYNLLNSGNQSQRVSANEFLKKNIFDLGVVINSLSKMKTAFIIDELIKSADEADKNENYELAEDIDNIIRICSLTECLDLVKLADYLDNNKFYILADKVDNFIKNANYGFFPKSNKIEEKKEEMFQPRSKGSLSTRHCPDHRGVQTIRIEENTYQCPLDGKIYDYINGYENYKGQRVPGGSVAAQTPDTSDFGGIPMSLYEPASSALNRVH